MSLSQSILVLAQKFKQIWDPIQKRLQIPPSKPAYRPFFLPGLLKISIFEPGFEPLFHLKSKCLAFWVEGKNNSENLPRILLKFSLKFSLNFHSIFKRNFWFCKIHLKIERNWEKKKLQKFIVRLTGEWKKAILENFGKFLEFFGKLTFFETSLHHLVISTTSHVFHGFWIMYDQFCLFDNILSNF